MSRLVAIAQAMEFSIANSQTNCQTPYNWVFLPPDAQKGLEKLVAVGRQTIGFRFMLGVTSLAQVSRYGLNAASLQTQVAAGTPAAFTSPSGRTFVAPSDASLQAAAKLLTPDATTQTWPIPYEVMRTKPEGTGAYPGAMLVYAQVPTKGLPPGEASQYGQLLKFAAGDGQVPGTTVGQLPPGYLPMTSANGLGALAAYTKDAADAVAAQSGTVPPIVPGVATPSASSSPPPSSSSPDVLGTHDSKTPSPTPSGRSTRRRLKASPPALWPRSARRSESSPMSPPRWCGGFCTSQQPGWWGRPCSISSPASAA
jgi:hypothetical protein